MEGKAAVEAVEVIARIERRRKWSEAEKAALVAETDKPGGGVAAVARERGVSRSLLYNWRSAREAWVGAASPDSTALAFLPVGAIAGVGHDASQQATSAPWGGGGSGIASCGGGGPGAMEIALANGVRLRLGVGVDEAALSRVLRAEKRLL